MSIHKKTKFALVLIAGVLATVPQARAKTVLPDSCGKEDVRFDVKDQKDQPPPTGPEEGKAQIIFIAKVDPHVGYPQVRFGIDGIWAGATRDNSYFAVSVTPGEHHICAAKEPQFAVRLEPAMATFTAEAGKVYYYEFRIIRTDSGSGGGFVGGKPVTGGNNAPSFSSTFGDVPADEGKYRMKVSPLSVATPKKK